MFACGILWMLCRLRILWLEPPDPGRQLHLAASVNHARRAGGRSNEFMNVAVVLISSRPAPGSVCEIWPRPSAGVTRDVGLGAIHKFLMTTMMCNVMLGTATDAAAESYCDLHAPRTTTYALPVFRTWIPIFAT